MANIDSTMEKPTVLIVDDSPDDIALIVELLKDLYKIKIAGNGEQALKVARSGAPPDIILLDIMMPVMDGYETCRRLKENPDTLNIPVIFLTSKAELEDELKGFALGAVDYITKPISPPILLARVQTHLQLKQVRDYLRDKNAFLEDEVQRRTQAIASAKKEWERTFDTVPDLIMLLDKDHRILRANRTMAERFGKTCQELIGRHCYEIVHGLSTPPDVCPHTRLLGSGKEERSEFMEDGLGLFLDVRTTPLYDEAGQLGGSVHVVHDITDRKQAEDALRKSEEHFRAIIENASDIILVVDKKGMISFASPSVEQTLGYKPEEIIGKSSLDLIAPADVPRAMQDFGNAILAKGTLVQNAFRVRHKDGSERMLEGVARNLFKNPSVAGFIMNVHDVTDRKRAEEALRESQGRFKSLIDNFKDIIFTIDLGGKITFASQSTKEKLGYESAEMINMNILNFIPEEDLPRAIESLQKGMKGKEKIAHFQTQIIPKSGEKLFFECSFSRVYKDGKVIGAQAIAIDFTERKRAEEELRRHRENLEVMVAERTTQLSAANKELEAFSYSVSHDLRAPLRSIDGFSKALLEEYQEKLDDTGKSFLGRVRKATQRMGLLIDDMLKLSRITQAEMKRGAVDLSGMVREITETHQKDNPDRTVDVTVQEGIVVQGDPYLLKIAMENLVGNAFKFTGKEAHPRIEFGTTVGDGKTACFILDNGAGFDMAYVGKLFSAFQRLHASDEFPGTGIGLATVQRIINRHGGRIWAEGEVGKGATFHFTLPL